MAARYVSLWEFTVRPMKHDEFLHFYGPGGVWAELFAKAPGYLGTALLSDRSDPLRYVTLDRRRSKEDHDAFLARFGQAYTELDKRCEELTAEERHLGSYSECGEADTTGLIEPDLELLNERVERMRTVRDIFAQGDWLTAEQLNALQVNPPGNKALPASDWKRRGRIFSVNYSGKEYFARYQFDALYQPLPIIKAILAAFGEVADSWALAAWFHFPSQWLVRRDAKSAVSVAPKDSLDQGSAVVDAATKRRTSYVA
jgi:hypothetical protein